MTEEVTLAIAPSSAYMLPTPHAYSASTGVIAPLPRSYAACWALSQILLRSS